MEATGDKRWKVVHKPVPLRPPMELVLDHLDVEPPNRLRLREEDDASVFHVEYRLEAVRTGTRLTQVSELEWKRLPQILHGTFARGVRRDVRAQLRALKRLLES